MIDNSTISGNSTTGWHGGGMFVTDGVTSLSNSTVAGNTSPTGTSGGLFVGTFGPSSATLELQNTIVSGSSGDECFLAPFGTGAVAINSLGNNVVSDGSCNPNGTTDQSNADAQLGVLADNGGATLTHALGAGSPAIGAANKAAAPTTDQRGFNRDASPDAGAFEFGAAP
jgi:hypothetical protein